VRAIWPAVRPTRKALTSPVFSAADLAPSIAPSFAAPIILLTKSIWRGQRSREKKRPQTKCLLCLLSHLFASLDCGREATTDRLVDLSSVDIAVIGDSHAVPDRKKEWAHKPCLRLPRPSPSGSWTQSERYVNSGMREESKHEQCIRCEVGWVWPTACAETCWSDILPRQTTGSSILYRQCTWGTTFHSR
jgi:hypothetical protein